MVICKFFLQGSCRFGENCKFEHQYPDNQNGSSILRPQNFNPATLTSGTTTVDTTVLVQSVQNDMKGVEKSGQWLLSCFAPFREKSVFPGFEDHSFEEIRFGYYEAKNNGTLDVYVQQLNMKLQEAMMRVKSLQNPTDEAIKIIRSIYNEHTQPQGGSFAGTSSIFGNTQQSVFSMPTANTTPFGQPNNIGNNIFSNNQPNNPTAQSIFATANQKLFSGNQQVTGNTNPTSIFANSQLSNSPFDQTLQSNNPTGFQQTQNNNQTRGYNTPFQQTTTGPFTSAIQNFSFVAQQPRPAPPIFKAPSNVSNSPLAAQLNTNNMPFQQNTVFNVSNSPLSGAQQAMPSLPQSTANGLQSENIFGSNITTTNFDIQSSGDFDESVYSKPEDLSESDIKSYQAETFEFGKVPEKPPHISMC